MSILIKGMEMPKDGNWKTFRIYPDGTCAVPNWQGDCKLIDGAQAVPAPPHGRLIDADALEQEFNKLVYHDSWYYNTLHHAPTVISAEEDE